MTEALRGIYNKRHLERTDYYRIIESSFDEFERSYPDQFEEKYGYLRTEVMKAVYSFLECGIPENGMARVRCEECGHNFFVAYSCRCRVVCPSCSNKRSIKLLKLLVQSANWTIGKYFTEALGIEDGDTGGNNIKIMFLLSFTANKDRCYRQYYMLSCGA